MGLRDRFGFTDSDKQRGVSGLPDRPKCSAAELKNAFDWLCTQLIMPRINDLLDFLDSDSLMGSTVVEYGNEKIELQEAVNRLRQRLDTLGYSSGAANIGAVKGEETTTVQALLDAIQTEIKNMELGAISIPDGGITTGKLASNCKAPLCGTADYVKGYGPIVRYDLSYVRMKGTTGYSHLMSLSPSGDWSSDPSINTSSGGNIWLSSSTGSCKVTNAGTYNIRIYINCEPPASLTDANNQIVWQSCTLTHTDVSGNNSVIAEDYKQMHNQHGCVFLLEKKDFKLENGAKLNLSFGINIANAESYDEVPMCTGYLELERIGD